MKARRSILFSRSSPLTEETLKLLKSDTRRIGARRIPDYEKIVKVNDGISGSDRHVGMHLENG